MTSPRASGSVVAAGVVAIIGSCFAILGAALGLFGMTMLPSSPSASQLPAGFQTMATVVLVVWLAVSVFGIATGVGILRLKNWARITALVWAAISAGLCSVILLFSLVMPLPTPSGQHPIPAPAVRMIVIVFYSIPVGVGTWWLILFNRPRVRAEFSGEALIEQPALEGGMNPAVSPAAPRCPLPIAIIAGFLFFSFLSAFLMPLVHIPVPVILFGHRLHGSLATGAFVLTTMLMLVAAVGLWKLKLWSYPLIVGLQSIWLLSGLVTCLSPSFEQNMREVFDEMQTPNADYASQLYLHHRSLALIGLVPAVALLAILLYYRSAFLKAAEAAKNNPL
jgi:uncharacterized membrane protein (DUF2068 family)